MKRKEIVHILREPVSFGGKHKESSFTPKEVLEAMKSAADFIEKDLNKQCQK